MTPWFVLKFRIDKGFRSGFFFLPRGLKKRQIPNKPLSLDVISGRIYDAPTRGPWSSIHFSTRFIPPSAPPIGSKNFMTPTTRANPFVLALLGVITPVAFAQDCAPTYSGRMAVPTGAPFTENIRCATNWDEDNRPETPRRLVLAGSGSPPFVWLNDHWSEPLWRGFNGTGGVYFETLSTWDFDGPGPLPEYLVACGDFGFSLPNNSGAAYYDGYSWRELVTPQGFSMYHAYPADMVVWQPPGKDSASKILVMGGEFDRSVEPLPVYAKNVATWDKTWFGVCGAGLNAAVESLVVWESYPGAPDSVVVATGSFTASGATPLNHIAKWDGQTWSPIGDGLPGYDGNLGWGKKLGLFDPDGDGPGRPHIMVSYPTQGQISVARYDGTAWTTYPQLGAGSITQLSTWQPTPESTPKLLVNGSWGVNQPPAYLWDEPSGAWVPFIPMASTLGNGRSLTQIQPLSGGPARPPGDPWILCNWEASTPAGLTTNGLASFDGSSVSLFPTGFRYNSVTTPKIAALTTWDPDASGPESPVLVAAGFVAYSGLQSFGNISSWNAKGWNKLGANGISGTLNALTTWSPAPGQPRRLVAGGNPNMVGAGSAQLGNLASMSPSSGVWTALGTGLSANIYALASWKPPGSASELLIAGGSFNSAGLTNLNQIGSWDGTRWSALGPAGAPGVNGIVYALLPFDPDGAGPEPELLVAGGAFTSAGGSPASRIARWDGASWKPFAAGLNGTVYSLFAWDHDNDPETPARLVAGGLFTQADAKPATGLAVWDGTTWYGLGSLAGGKVSAILAWDFDGAGPALPQLVVGGAFTSVNADPAIKYLVTWNGSSWQLVSENQPGGVIEALQLFDADGPGPLAPDLVAGTSISSGRGALYFAVHQQAIITAQPQSACASAGATLRIEARGNQTLSYAWYRDGVALTEGTQSDGSIARGVYQPELRISQPASGVSHAYTVRVFSGCTFIESAPASLATTGCCAGDLNDDNAVDDADFLLFLPQYDISACAEPAMPAGCRADLNRDGFVDDSDFQLFVIAYNALVCPALLQSSEGAAR